MRISFRQALARHLRHEQNDLSQTLGLQHARLIRRADRSVLRRRDLARAEAARANAETFERVEYGRLAYAVEAYTLYALKSRDWNPALPAPADGWCPWL